MKCFVSVILLAITAWMQCTADLPPYCGHSAEKFKYEPVADGNTLKQVFLVVRHGDRIANNASQCWKGDTAVWDCLITEAVVPVINRDQHVLKIERMYRKEFISGREELPGNCALGQLTSIGFKQDAMLGQAFKALYVDSGFLSPNITVSDYQIRSSDLYRTMQSAAIFNNNMFPPSLPPGEDRVNVMDIYTVDPTYDDIYPNANICPKLKVYEAQLFKTPGFLQHYLNVSMPLVKEIQTALGDENFGYVDLYHLFDCLNVHFCHSKDVPSAITPELYQRIVDEISWLVYTIYSYPTPQAYSRAGIGFLIKEMSEEARLMMAGESKRKFLLYSGHDATIMPLLNAFNISDGKWAPYSSYLVFEIYSSTTVGFAVRIIYNGKVMELPFCGGKTLCDTDTFNKWLVQIVPVDRKTECGV